LESLEQQYAAEGVKVDADDKLLKRLERGIRDLKGVAEPAGQCRAEIYLCKVFEDSQSRLNCGFSFWLHIANSLSALSVACRISSLPAPAQSLAESMRPLSLFCGFAVKACANSATRADGV